MTVTDADVAAYYDAKDEDVFARAESEGARPVHQLSASGVGRCLRRAAYQVAGTPPDPDWVPRPGSRTALIGEMIHEGYLRRLAAECGPDPDGAIEQPSPVRVAGVTIPGRSDFFDTDAQYLPPEGLPEGSVSRYDPDTPLGSVMFDLKTVGSTKWRSVLEHRDPPYDHWIQVLLYAVGRIQAGYGVDWLVIQYLNRDTAEKHFIVRRYTPERGAEAVERVEAIVRAAGDPDRARREERGPSSALGTRWSPCDSCPWLWRCWPSRSQAAPQAAAIADLPGGEAEAVAAYAAARRVKQRAADDQQFYKALLSGVEAGVYADPDGYRAWEYRRNRRGSVQVQATTRPADLPTE